MTTPFPMVRDREAGAPLAPDADADLMARAAAGDQEAFAVLVDRYKDGLVAYLARLTGSPERAEDIAQEAFFRLYRAAPRYRERGSFTGYLYRIAVNLLRSEARRQRRWSILRPEIARREPGVVEPRAPARVAARELRDRLTRAVAELPLPLRVPLVLYEIEEWPQREIARLLGCREGTVKSRLHRARARLRRALTGDGDLIAGDLP